MGEREGIPQEELFKEEIRALEMETGKCGGVTDAPYTREKLDRLAELQKKIAELKSAAEALWGKKHPNCQKLLGLEVRIKGGKMGAEEFFAKEQGRRQTPEQPAIEVLAASEVVVGSARPTEEEQNKSLEEEDHDFYKRWRLLQQEAPSVELLQKINDLIKEAEMFFEKALRVSEGDFMATQI